MDNNRTETPVAIKTLKGEEMLIFNVVFTDYDHK